MTRATTIELSHGDHARVAAERFGDHQDMSTAHVIRWLAQFDDDHLPIAVRLLEKIRYYNLTNIRSLCQQLIQALLESLPQTAYASVAIAPIGGPGSGSAVIARAIRELVRGTRYHLVDTLQLAQASPGTFDALVFFDDFSGTGRTLGEWWESVEPILRPLDAEVVVGLLVLNYRARGPVEQFASRVVCIEELGEADDVFHDACPYFNAEERLILLEYSKRTGCGPKYVRGFGDCGLILSFRHGCPNNSLPALWHERDGWRALFRRRSL